MPMAYDIFRFERYSRIYHVFDTEAEAHRWAMVHPASYQSGHGPWSCVRYREWNEANLNEPNVIDHCKHKKET